MNYYTNEYNQQFRRIGHYRKYPQMMPFVGKEYEEGGILLLLESHYFPKKSHVHLDPEKWYSGSSALLNCDEKEYIHTRDVVDVQWDGDRTESKERTINGTIRTINVALKEALRQERGNMFQYFCCMNTFQRPAEYGQGIKPQDMDFYVSSEVIQRVIEILKPGCICFVSQEAAGRAGREDWFADKVKEQNDHIQVEVFWSASRNKWSQSGAKEKGKGREKFKRIIKKNKN